MSDGPSKFELARPSVVRLNRRVIYVVGAVLVLAFVAGLVALRAQTARVTEAHSAHRAALPPRGRPWFADLPDQAPARRAPSPDPAPTIPSPPPAKPARVSDEEMDRQRRARAALSASIAVAAFEPSGHPRPSGPPDRRVAGTIPPVEYLRASVRAPASPYELKAGSIIPALMLTGINSDLPGQIVGQVRENVYDSDTGEHLLVPQGTRLVGLYDHHVVYGQQRVLITWKRLVLPNGSSLSLRDGMPGTDALGAAGVADDVNNHVLRLFGNALLLSVISAGVQLSQLPDFGREFRGPSAGNVLGAGVGQQLGSVSSELIRRGMNVAPTLEVRPGYPVNVMVTQDVIFPGPYRDGATPGPTPGPDPEGARP